MGKVDDQRRMREARYEARNKMLAAVLPVVLEELVVCGHKGASGKTCTRPKDHPEKNHRYK